MRLYNNELWNGRYMPPVVVKAFEEAIADLSINEERRKQIIDLSYDVEVAYVCGYGSFTDSQLAAINHLEMDALKKLINGEITIDEFTPGQYFEPMENWRKGVLIGGAAIALYAASFLPNPTEIDNGAQPELKKAPASNVTAPAGEKAADRKPDVAAER